MNSSSESCAFTVRHPKRHVWIRLRTGERLEKRWSPCTAVPATVCIALLDLPCELLTTDSITEGYHKATETECGGKHWQYGSSISTVACIALLPPCPFFSGESSQSQTKMNAVLRWMGAFINTSSPVDIDYGYHRFHLENASCAVPPSIVWVVYSIFNIARSATASQQCRDIYRWFSFFPFYFRFPKVSRMA